MTSQQIALLTKIANGNATLGTFYAVTPSYTKIIEFFRSYPAILEKFGISGQQSTPLRTYTVRYNDTHGYILQQGQNDTYKFW